MLHVEAAAEFGGQVDLLTSGNGADGPDLTLRGGATVARTPRAFWAGVAAGILLAVAAQLFVHRGPGQLEQVADAIAQPIGIVDQPAVEFEFEVDAGAPRAEAGRTDLPVEAGNTR